MAVTKSVRDTAREYVAQDNRDANDEIDLLELLYRLLENWKWIIAAALVCAIAAGAYTILRITPTYQATAKLYVLNSSDSAINLSDLQIGSYLASDYQEVFKAWEVHEMVIENLNLDYSYAQMQSMLSISNPADTRMLYITVTSTDPKLAMDIANEYASVAQKYIYDMMSTEEPNIFSTALEPASPIAPSKTKNVMLGFIAGAFVAIAVVVIRFLMDDKIKTAEDVLKYADLPTLAVVPVLENSGSRKEKTSALKQRR